MQTLLLPAGRSGISPTAAAASHLRRVPSLNIGTNVSFLSSNSVPSLKTLQSSSLANRGSKHCFPILASSQIPPTFTSQNDESEKAKLAQVLKIFLSLSLSLFFYCWLICLFGNRKIVLFIIIECPIMSFITVWLGEMICPSLYL